MLSLLFGAAIGTDPAVNDFIPLFMILNQIALTRAASSVTRLLKLTHVTDSFSFVYAEHFQPERVLLGFVQDNVPTFNISLRPIALGEID
jgi:hypothetical protein